MWSFRAKQKQFRIGKVKVGGVPGRRPTVLIGTVFYHGQRILLDEIKGEFDKEKAQELIKVQEEFSDKTGNPHMLDVVGATSEAMRKSLDFVAEVADAPILLDGISSSVRIDALQYVMETGLTNTFLYNSITPGYKKEELNKIKEVGLDSAVLLAMTTRDFTHKGRIKAIRELLPIVQEAGIQKPLIDTCVVDIPSLGIACRTLLELKDELGFPVGCGPHNAISTWRGLKRKMGKKAKDPSMAASATMAVAAGADFVLYGPIESANYVFPAVAMADAAYAQVSLCEGKGIDPGHPLFKIA